MYDSKVFKVELHYFFDDKSHQMDVSATGTPSTSYASPMF